MKKSLLTLIVMISMLALSTTAYAQTRMRFSVPLNSQDSDVTVTITNNGVTKTATATIKPNDGAKKKRDKIKKALEDQGFSVLPVPSGVRDQGPGIDIFHLANGTKVTFDPGKTGENKDEITVKKAHSATISFDNELDGTGLDGEPATYTAGVVTDRGRASVTYEAEFPDETIDGGLVAERLFSGLVAAASELGAVIGIGDQIMNVQFDEGVARKGAGVTFGTTAIQGIRATVEGEGDEESR